MAGTLVMSYSESRLVQKVVFDWTANAGGDCTGDCKRVSGKVMRVTFVPSVAVSPTGGYTVKVNDNDTVDVLAGYGAAGLSATATTSVVPMVNDAVLGQPSIPYTVDGLLSIVVAGAGSGGKGTVSLYIER